MPRPDGSIYVGRLPKSTRAKDLEELFESYGRLMRCDIKYGSEMAYAFIDFEDRREAEDCVKYEHGRELDGQAITVEWAKGGKDKRLGYSQGYDECFRCRRPGHWARECPEMMWGRQRGGGGGGFRGGGGGGGGGGGRRRSPSPRRRRSRSRDRKRRSHSRSHDRRRRSKSNERRRSRSHSDDKKRSRSRSGSRRSRSQSNDRKKDKRYKSGSRNRSRSESRSRSRSRSKSRSRSRSKSTQRQAEKITEQRANGDGPKQDRVPDGDRDYGQEDANRRSRSGSKE